MLALEGITRRFGAVTALEQASFTAHPGRVHALLGENGAGKTTLMRIAFGALSPTSGVVRWNGVPVHFRSPADALAAGIGMVHQHFTLVPAMTVAENVALGGRGQFDLARAAARVQEVSARAGLVLDPQARVDTLPVGAQQRTEIVKALARDVQLLILDEPTAVLAPAEAQELLGWARRYANDGHAVVLITHKLRDALAIADDVTVLHRGRVALAAPAHECTEERLAKAMLGGPLQRADLPSASDAPPRLQLQASSIADLSTDAVQLACDGVTWVDRRGVTRLHDATLTVRAGEIVGIAAVEGSGQQELLRLFAGRLTPTRGQVRRPARVGFVPEDRHRDALLLEAPLFENLALEGADERRGRIRWSAFRDETARLMTQFDVRAQGPGAIARTLSGGNQQKFVLARELRDSPKALVVENPSRGLDFKATAAVQASLRAARDAGTAVVLYSSDLDEVLQLADRIYVLFNGRLRAVASDRDSVGRAMLGGADA
jgi:general nucleoside transport system ATP-binding protein